MTKARKKKFVISGVILLFCAIPLFAILGAVVAYFLPSHYYSKVTMELKNEAYAQHEVSAQPSNRPADPIYIETQFQILRSKDILDPVIANLHLADKLVRDYSNLSEESRRQIAYSRLQEMLDLRQERNMRLIDIGVYASDPQLAADIANQIAEVYKNKREEEVRRFINSGYNMAQKEIERLQKETNEAYGNLMKIAKAENIPDLSTNPEKNTEPGYKTDYLAAKKIYMDKQALLKDATLTLKAQGMQKNIPFEPAHIWEKAVPDPIPHKPQMWMLVALGAIIGIPFAVAGFVLLLVGLCSSTTDADVSPRAAQTRSFR